MPEGPEVAVITKGLNTVFKNKYLFDIQITTSSRYREKKPDGFNKLTKILNKSKIKIKEVKCKGKLIYFILDDNTYIINRLGMSGFWSHKPGKTPVRDTDSEGKPIVNPLKSSRGRSKSDSYQYIIPCGFFCIPSVGIRHLPKYNVRVSNKERNA